jgi:hypothetical protein
VTRCSVWSSQCCLTRVLTAAALKHPDQLPTREETLAYHTSQPQSQCCAQAVSHTVPPPPFAYKHGNGVSSGATIEYAAARKQQRGTYQMCCCMEVSAGLALNVLLQGNISSRCKQLVLFGLGSHC